MIMKIAIFGRWDYRINCSISFGKKGHEVTVMEKERVRRRTLHAGFKDIHWNWYLEPYIPSPFCSDSDILNFAKEIGFKKIYFRKPVTSSLFVINNKISDFPLDTPIDLLRFPF